MKSLAFTGHRPRDLGGYNEDNPIAQRVKLALKQLITKSYNKGYTKFITGMAQGVDQWAGEIVAELKQQKNDIVLIAALPMATQSSIWPSNGQTRWLNLLKQCDEIYLTDSDSSDEISTFEDVLRLSHIKNEDPKYMISKKLQNRNQWMVDRSDLLLAIWKGTPGGTGNCVNYALNQQKTVLQYNPLDDVVKLHKDGESQCLKI